MSEIQEMIDELETLKVRRHFLRCKIINYIKENIDSFPDGLSTGRLFHQRNRKNKLEERIWLNHMGDICDKELIRDSKIILNEINQ